jgi:hypothetical protein
MLVALQLATMKSFQRQKFDDSSKHRASNDRTLRTPLCGPARGRDDRVARRVLSFLSAKLTQRGDVQMPLHASLHRFTASVFHLDGIRRIIIDCARMSVVGSLIVTRELRRMFMRAWLQKFHAVSTRARWRSCLPEKKKMSPFGC